MKNLIRQTIGSSCLAIGVALLSGLATSTRADSYYTNNASATYNVATYWNPNGVPTSSINADCDNGANLCEILAADPTWTTFDLRAGNGAGATGAYWQQGSTVNCTSWFRMGVGSSTSVGTYSISGGTLNINGTSTYMRIGELGFGTLNITNGAVNHTGTTPNPCIIGSRDTGNYGNSSSPGGVINQFGGTFTNNGELWIGEGITAVTPGVVGTYNLSGGILAANSWLAIGRSWANGTLNMTGGTLIKSANNNFTMAGIGTTQTGTFNMSGGAFTNLAGTWIGETANAIFNLSGTGNVNALAASVGYNGGTGYLNISGGTFKSSQFNVGGNQTATSTSKGYVVQTGGTLTMSGGDNRIGGPYGAGDVNNIGIYSMSGGTMTTANNYQVGAYGQGEVNLSGGTVTATGGYPDVGRYGGAFGVLDISGGTFNNTTTGTKFIIGEQGAGILNIRGSGSLTNGSTSTAGALLIGGSENTAGSVGIVNLLGGTLNTLSVGTGTSGSANVYSALNFNGGTLQARGNDATFLQGLNGTYVYPSGGAIDSQGNNLTIAQNIVAPTGNGVTSIPINAVGAGYVTPPIVKITGGGGTNATAIAVTNGAGQVASILITSPGVNYTTVPTVTLVGGGFTSTASIGTVTIGANGTGGLTKMGSGTLTLTGNSTYGVTTISNGTVIVSGSLSGGATVVNGTLGGGGTIGGTTTMGTNTTLSPGITTPATTLTATNLTLNNANLAMNLNPNTTTPGTGNNDLIAANGALVFTGTNTVIPTIIGGSGSLSGVYTLISGGTSVSGGATNFAFLGGSRSTATFDTTSTPGSVLMTVVGNAASLVWVGTNGNNWDTATINWNNGGTADKFYALDNVTFDDTSSNGNVSLVGSLLPTTVVFNNNATNYVLSGTGFIKGAATLTMSGSGSVVLANSNSYTGGTTINSGTVQVGNGGSTGSLGSGPVVDNSLLIYDLGNALTNTAAISGSGSVIQAGAGTVYLTVSNTYTGFTVISSGIIKNGLANALPSGSGFNDVTNNGKLDLNTYSQSLDSLSGSGIVDTVAGGAPVLTVGGDNASTTFSGVLANTTGTLGLTKVGAGTLTLTGTNTFLNNTFVRAGTLLLDTGGVISNTAFGDVGQTTGDNALMILQGTGSFTTTSDFNVGDINNCIGVVNITGAATLTAQNMYVSSANGTSSSAQGTINQTNGTVTTRTSGDNALVIGGRSAASTYGIGIYNLYGGTVNVLNGGNLWCGGYGTGTMNVSGGSANLSGYVSVGRQTNGVGYLNISGGVVLQTNAGRYTLIGESGTGTLTLSGGLLGVTKLRLGSNGSGSGTVNLNGGTLAAQQILQVAGSGTFNFNGGILQASASNATFMQGLNSAAVQSGGAVIDTQTNSITILQGLTDGGGGGGLTKNGNGLLVLAGTNSYTGTTTVNAGELDGVPGASVSGAVTVANGTTNGVQVLNVTSPWTCGTLTYAASGTEYLNFAFGTNAPSLTVAPLQVNGDLDIYGTLDVIVSGIAVAPNTYPLITFTGSLNGTLPSVPYSLPNRTHGTLSQSGNTIYLTVSSTEPITWQPGTGNWDTTSLNWKDTAATVTAYLDGNPGDTVVFNDTPGSGSFTVTLTTNITPLSVNFSNNIANYAIAGSGSINGSTTALIKNGSGTVSLATTNTYAGGTIINAGTLQLGDRVANNGVVPGSIVDNALLVFANPGNQTNAGVISGTGALGKTGAGILNLAAVNTYGGITVVSNGVLQVGVPNAIPSGSGSNDVVVNGTVDLNTNSQSFDSLSGSGFVDTIAGGTPTLTVGGDNNNTTFGGMLTNTAGQLNLTKVGTGTLTMSGNSAFGGHTYIRFGTVVLSDVISNTTSGIWSDVGDLAGDTATLWVQGNGVLSVNGDLNLGDVGTLANPSSGTVNLSDNARVTALNMYVGSANGTSDGAIGVVNQTNGSVVLLNGGDHVLCVGGRAAGTTGGLGTYNLMNGSLNIAAGNSWIGGYGTGTFNQTGGAVTSTNWFSIGRQIGSTGIYNLSGGSLTDSATNNIFVGEGGDGTLNVSGTGQVVTVGGLVLCHTDGDATTTGTVSLNGGGITTPSVKTTLPLGASVFNFNGGTLRASTNNATFMQGLNTARVMTGAAVIDDGGYAITIGQSLLTGVSPDGGLLKLGAGVLTLSGANTYNGNTVVSNGTLLVNGSSGSGTVVAAGTLGGSGTINGVLTIQSGSTLAPSITFNTQKSLTVNSNVTLNAGSFTSMKLYKGSSPAQDQVVSSGTNYYNGTLAVTNLGTALAPGDSFQLFTGAGASGNFSSVVGNPGTGNLFSFNPTNGVLTVIAAMAGNPTNILFNVSGSTMAISWPADHLGWILQEQTNSLNVGLVAGTNAWFDLVGSSSVTSTNIVIDPNQQTVFFRLRHP